MSERSRHWLCADRHARSASCGLVRRCIRSLLHLDDVRASSEAHALLPHRDYGSALRTSDSTSLQHQQANRPTWIEWQVQGGLLLRLFARIRDALWSTLETRSHSDVELREARFHSKGAHRLERIRTTRDSGRLAVLDHRRADEDQGMTILFFLLLLLLHLHLHLPKTLCSECWKGFFHRVCEQAAHFDFGNQVSALGCGLGRKSVCLPSDFYRLGLVLAPCSHCASPSRVPKQTRRA